MPSPAEMLLVYVTCGDGEEARRIGRVLVEERLAACVNFRGHESIYRWHGAIESASEWGLLAKTTRACWPALEMRVRALHSYSLPCIIAWPLAEGLPPYLDWIEESTEVPS
ncbi:MAG: divalent-cation tolerance protein CutA [Acetobacteraceae bacterium]|nr:divalent-cation tolerance protein CutA [Acetobacteraceae bacterium]MBV8523763.1 divalent-cation tolerance protein CutA [Acetobacteraceae bacterium]MBV8589949.1 divalent-cation tolerance protein CutA [Acetobacteraceae bacterium]